MEMAGPPDEFGQQGALGGTILGPCLRLTQQFSIAVS
jgi:hypothetical protein